MRVLIVGGVAGGASAAARARRLCEDCEIVIFDRGEHVSFANCGLPYFVGDIIRDEESLLLATPELFAERLAIEVRVRTEVVAVDPVAREIHVRAVGSELIEREPYDALVLSPGARPIRPPIPGIDLPGVFQLRTIPDSKHIKAAAEGATHAVVVGGGFIGLEMAENLRHRGLEVTLLERAAQLMPPCDPEVAVVVQQRLEAEGVEVRLGAAVTAFHAEGGRLRVETEQGSLPADLVLLAIGVRPETELARDAGLALGPRGGIRVDAYMRTSDEHIWAVGDAVEVHDVLTDNWQLVPLAGPANRQGRIAAENLVGRDGDHEVARFRGVQGTAIAGVFGLAAAATGASEKVLKRANIPYTRIYLHAGHHVGYYPGAKELSLKLLFGETGRVLGAQAVGEAGVARRIDVIATTLQHGGTVYDLAEAELAYAPQFGAARDPVNVAGMIAVNHLQGDHPLADWGELGRSDAQLVDVRSPEEFARGHIDGARNIPIEQLRERLGELDPERPVCCVCRVGKRAYLAVRLLQQRGFDARNLSGGMKTWTHLSAAGVLGATPPR